VFDLPIWSLIVIVWAIAQDWPPVVLMWVCWGHGMCFSIFIFLRILFTRQSGVWGNYRQVRSAPKTFGFFIFHLIVYLIYIYFLMGLFEETVFDDSYVLIILVPIGLYFLSQLVCLVYRIVKGEEAWIDQNFFDRSLLRIVPMHIMIIGALFLKGVVDLTRDGTGALLFLLVIKLLADTGTFIFSLKGFRK
jgi:hypothetical protein